MAWKGAAKESLESRPILSVDEIDAEWWTVCLRAAGYIPQTWVVEFESTRVPGQGLFGERYRFEFTYNMPDVLSPDSAIVKVSPPESGSIDVLQYSRGREREVLFYKYISPHSELSVPQCYFAHFDREGGRSLLVLEDTTPGRTLEPGEALSLDQVELALDQLAVFHAQWWNHGLLRKKSWLTQQDDQIERWIEAYFANLPAMAEEHRGRAPALIEAAERLAVIARNRDKEPQKVPPPLTLNHTDISSSNLVFEAPEGGRFAVIDWEQVSVKSTGAKDVSRLLVMCLDAEQRRGHETDLLERYHQRLCEGRRVKKFNLELLTNHYRMAMIDLVFPAVLFRELASVSPERAELLLDQGIVRIEAAFSDHDIPAMLG